MPTLNDTIWVEAERDRTRGPRAAILSVKDVRLRRKLAEDLGKHNVHIPIEEMFDNTGISTTYLRDLMRGYPVQFKMPYREYLGLLKGETRLNGLDGLAEPAGLSGARLWEVKVWDADEAFFIEGQTTAHTVADAVERVVRKHRVPKGVTFYYSALPEGGLNWQSGEGRL